VRRRGGGDGVTRCGGLEGAIVDGTKNVSVKRWFAWVMMHKCLNEVACG